MTTTVIVNGNTYTDDSDPNTGMGAGGFRTRLLPMISDVMGNMNTDLAGANTAAANATASAASALAAPGTTGTSTTSATIATGSVTITIQASKTIVVGSSFKIASTASPSNWMHGDVTAYNSSTGALTVNATRIQGSGTFAAWTASLSGPAFADGAIGGSYVSALSANLALISTSPKLTVLQTGGVGGGTVTLPDATTLAAGPFAQAIQHNGPSSLFNNAVPGFDIPILDHSSKLLGFVQPYSYAEFGLADNTTVGGQWQTSGLMPIGALAQSKITLASACGGTGGTWTKNITLDSTRTLILIYGTSLHAVVYNSSSFTFGAPVLLRTVLSTTGVDATVAAVLVAANSVLVHSVQDSTTALQSVVLSISGTTITPGTMVPTTLATAVTRIADLITVGTAFVLGLMNGTTAISTIVTTVSGTVPTLGAVQSNTTVGPPALIAWSSTVFTVVTISATAITAKAYSISGVTQTPGSSATTIVTTTDSFALRLLGTGNWAVICINTGAKGTVLSLTGTVPAFSAQIALSSVVTTITTGGAVLNLSSGAVSSTLSSAVSGTDSSGRFVTEFSGWSDLSGAASLVPGGLVAKGFAASQVATALGNTGAFPQWAVTSAKESAMFSFTYGSSNVLLNEYRVNAVANNTAELSVPDPLYPKLNLARNTLGVNGTTSTIGITDGSQLSLRYRNGTGYIELLPKPVSVCADMRFASKVAGNDAQAWVAFNQAPDLACTIQLMGVV